MSIKQITINFQELGKEGTFRFDYDFVEFQNFYSNKDSYPFDQLFSLAEEDSVAVNELDGDFSYAEIGNVSKHGDVDPIKLNFEERKKEDENYYKKIEKGDILRVKRNDILISKIRPNLKKYVFIDEENKECFFTSAFIHLVPKKINKILFYSFVSVFFENLIAISRQGKGYPSIKEHDLRYLRFDKKTIDRLSSKQTQINAQLEPIEKRIKQLKSKMLPMQEVIDRVFVREFKLDLATFEDLKKVKYFRLNLSTFANNKDLRQSTKFHREAGYFVNQELRKITNKKIKHFLSEPIVLGQSISPSDYDDNGEYFYISMANIKNWKFEMEEARLVSKVYANSNQNKTVQNNDILIARSGEGTIGKLALIEDEGLKGIFADFTMRIRLKDYNPLFAYYYFRTDYFQYLIEINKKGLGNNTNIFPSQIQEFPIINISLKDQQRIVDEIRAELEKQEDIKNKIEVERNKIDQIIENIMANV